MLNKLAPQKVNFKQKLHLVFFRGEGAGERLIFTKVMSYISYSLCFFSWIPVQGLILIYTFTILNVFDMNLIRIFLLDQFLVCDLLGECGRFRRLFLP